MQNLLLEFPTELRGGQKHKHGDSGFVPPTGYQKQFEDWNSTVCLEVRAKVATGLPKVVNENTIFPVPHWGGQRKYIVDTAGNLLGTHPQAPVDVISALNREGLLSAEFTKERNNTSWLEDAFNELAACPDLAVDEGMDKPSQLALMKAKGLLEIVSGHVEDQPDIYPIDEGSIAIDFRNLDVKCGVIFLIEKDGSGVYLSRTRKSKGRVRVDDAADLLSEGGLLEIKRVGIR